MKQGQTRSNKVKQDLWSISKEKRQAAFIGHIMRREGLEHLITNGKLEGRRDTGAWREISDGLVDIEKGSVYNLDNKGRDVLKDAMVIDVQIEPAPVCFPTIELLDIIRKEPYKYISGLMASHYKNHGFFHLMFLFVLWLCPFFVCYGRINWIAW